VAHKGGGTTISGAGTVERQTQVAERRSGPFRLNLITGCQWMVTAAQTGHQGPNAESAEFEVLATWFAYIK